MNDPNIIRIALFWIISKEFFIFSDDLMKIKEPQSRELRIKPLYNRRMVFIGIFIFLLASSLRRLSLWAVAIFRWSRCLCQFRYLSKATPRNLTWDPLPAEDQIQVGLGFPFPSESNRCGFGSGESKTPLNRPVFNIVQICLEGGFS